jgi:CheY-like chemotaxis protein/Zn finger protein HypA/HybF involved in hydrogenase expression
LDVLPDFGSTSAREAREGSDEGVVETRDFEKLDEEEKAVLQGVFELRIREITPRIGPDGVSYEGLEEMRRTYGGKGLRHILGSLAEKGFLHVKEHDPVAACPKCDSHKIAVRLECRSCGSINVKRVKILEHVLCGFMGAEDGFRHDGSLRCPKCGKAIESDPERPLNGDPRSGTRVIDSIFRCRDCSREFDKPEVRFECLECSLSFDFRMARYESLHGYVVPADLKRWLERKSVKVLFIEDDDQNFEIMKSYLQLSKPAEIFDSERAGSGEEGLERCTATSFDLILLDMRMPGMDGMETLDAIRRRGVETPVIFMTSHDDLTIAVEAMKRGAADYVVKSMESYKKLYSIIKKVLEASNAREFNKGSDVYPILPHFTRSKSDERPRDK